MGSWVLQTSLAAAFYMMLLLMFFLMGMVFWMIGSEIHERWWKWRAKRWCEKAVRRNREWRERR